VTNETELVSIRSYRPIKSIEKLVPVVIVSSLFQLPCCLDQTRKYRLILRKFSKRLLILLLFFIISRSGNSIQSLSAKLTTLFCCPCYAICSPLCFLTSRLSLSFVSFVVIIHSPLLRKQFTSFRVL